ncbi:MAG: DegV family protein [Eubacteriales bacterium]
MERIKFIVDSSGDISPEDFERLDIQMVPVGIVVDGEYHKDRIDFSPSEFNEILKTCKEVPSSVAVNPQEWFEILEPYVLKNDYDRLVITGVGLPLSGTLSSAVQARDMLKEKYPEEMKKLEIDIYDSNISTIGFGVGIVKAVEMYKSGVAYPAIKEFLIDWFDHVEVLYVAFSFDLPKKSGRINAPSAYVGSLLNIRPVMLVKEGKFTLHTKIRGDKNVPAKLLEVAKERMRDGSDFFCMSGTHPTVVQDVRTLFEAHYGKEMFSISEAGPAMTLNAGWDMYCLGYLSNKTLKVQNPL